LQKLMEEYKCKLEDQIALYEEEVRKGPRGKFYAYRDNGNSKWYVKKSNKTEYLEKTKRDYAKRLAKKRYAEAKLVETKRELNAVNKYLLHKGNLTNVDEKYLCDDSPYRELLIDKYKSYDEEDVFWMNEDYPRNEEYKESLMYDNSTGISYRSKSEFMIQTALIKSKIAYRYEEELEINGVKLHPDFTIRKRYSGEIVYWEHLGMMDDPDYVCSFSWKINQYASAGIYLGEKLFVTYETKTTPLILNEVYAVIDKII